MAMAHEFNFADQSKDLPPTSTGEAFGEVIRDYEPVPGVKWRFGKPNYERVNKAYFNGRTKKHPEGSLEQIVTKVVKNWEVESHHIYDIRSWQTMDIGKFKMSLNGSAAINAQKMADVGPYNALIGETPGYSSKANTFESANETFSGVFPEGYAWEVLEVYSGPPNVSFRWRHFGKFSGEFVDTEGTIYEGNGQMIEVVGLCMAKVNKDLKIEELQIFYDPATQIAPLMKPAARLCPFSCLAPSTEQGEADDDEQAALES